MENQNDIHRELTSLPVGKLLWKYSVPAIVGTMVMSLYNVIDRIFIGQGVGADAISGLALTFPIMSLAGAIGMLVGLGASARISIVQQYDASFGVSGESHVHHAHRCFLQSYPRTDFHFLVRLGNKRRSHSDRYSYGHFGSICHDTFLQP